MNKTWIAEAHERLFNEPYNYNLKLRYSKKFKSFNANVKLRGDLMTFSFSHEWKYVGKEIIIGLVQELLLKIKNKFYSIVISLY